MSESSIPIGEATGTPTDVPCLCCGKRLDRVWQDHAMQPYAGVMCQATGTYGSRVFDPVFADSEWLQFIVCDDCLRRHKERFKMAHKIADPKVEYREWNPGPQPKVSAS